MRRRWREFITSIGGKVIHPVLGLPGGVAKGIALDDLPKWKELAKDSVDFCLFTLQVFKDIGEISKLEKNVRHSLQILCTP